MPNYFFFIYDSSTTYFTTYDLIAYGPTTLPLCHSDHTKNDSSISLFISFYSKREGAGVAIFVGGNFGKYGASSKMHLLNKESLS